ncbi:MAG: B12-binding domain-containing radical SAM protein, partial [Gaiellales bacterium]
HTPFQWSGMAPPDQLRVKQDYLRRALKGRQLKLSLHDVRTSKLEGALGRGHSITGDVLETAWRAGARFDAWSEHHREELWRDAFAAAGRDLEVEATRERDPLDPLPWDHVRSGVSKEFLLDEWWQSRAERPTGDCRWDGCSDCGACVGPVRNRLVEA